MAQIEKDTLARSENPNPKNNNTIGKLTYSKVTKKLSRSQNLIFKSKYKPITPNINNSPSTIKIVLTEIYPSLNTKYIMNENTGGLNRSEYPAQ